MNREIRAEATIYDVAEKAGVAISTVSLALRRDSRVRPATREKVLAAAKALNFTASVTASSLAKGSTPFVAVCCHLYPDSLSSQSFSGIEMLLGIKERLKGTKYAIYLVDWEYDHDAALARITDMAQRRFICGSLGLSFVPNQRDKKNLGKSEIPMVLTEVALPGVSSVRVDQNMGGRLAAESLLSAGCKTLAILSGAKLRPGELSPISARLEGFRRRLKKAGRTVAASSMFHGPSFSFKDGYEAAGKIIRVKPEVDGIFCAAGDKAALGLLEGLKAAGKKVPEDIKIVGYDGIQEAYYSDPPLTTVMQPFFEMGLRAADLLVNAIEGGSRRPVKILLRPKLVKGKSA